LPWIKTLIINIVTFGSPQVPLSGAHEDLQDINTAFLWWAESIEYDPEIDTFSSRWHCMRFEHALEEAPEDIANRNWEREKIEMYCRNVNKNIGRRWIVSLKSEMQEGVVEVS
jgi:hypothetical protein